MKPRKIAVLTGTRAEYGLLKPIIKKIASDKDMELALIVAAMHLSDEFGETIKDIEKDGFPIAAKIETIIDKESPEYVVKSMGVGIKTLPDILKNINPDILLVIADRAETMAATIAAAYMNIPIAHIHGGDISGHIDEPARHAITKFAHIHFPATQKSANRILRMGEEPWRVHVVGAPCMDTILNESFLSKEEVEKEFDIDLSKPFLIMIQHSVSSEYDEAKENIDETLSAIKELGMQTIIVYPNSDAGGRKIIEEIEKMRNLPFIRIHKSIPHKKFLSLMKYASAMIGNSSSGIIESPAFHLPVVNIGTRQAGRECVNNVINADYDRDEIIDAIETAISPEFKASLVNCKSPYGDGCAAEKIVSALKNVEIDKNLMQKKWSDNDV